MRTDVYTTGGQGNHTTAFLRQLKSGRKYNNIPNPGELLDPEANLVVLGNLRKKDLEPLKSIKKNENPLIRPYIFLAQESVWNIMPVLKEIAEKTGRDIIWPMADHPQKYQLESDDEQVTCTFKEKEEYDSEDELIEQGTGKPLFYKMTPTGEMEELGETFAIAHDYRRKIREDNTSFRGDFQPKQMTSPLNADQMKKEVAARANIPRSIASIPKVQKNIILAQFRDTIKTREESIALLQYRIEKSSNQIEQSLLNMELNQVQKGLQSVINDRDRFLKTMEQSEEKKEKEEEKSTRRQSRHRRV